MRIERKIARTMGKTRSPLVSPKKVLLVMTLPAWTKNRSDCFNSSSRKTSTNVAPRFLPRRRIERVSFETFCSIISITSRFGSVLSAFSRLTLRF